MIKYKKFIKECENSGQLFNYWQMFEIRYGFENGLSIEQIKLYANPKFSWSQMRLIREFIINNKDMSIDTLKFLIQLEVL